MGRLADAAAAFRPVGGGRPSMISKWLDTLEPEDRADADALFADTERFGHAHVSQLIEQVYGVSFAAPAVRGHRERVARGCTR